MHNLNLNAQLNDIHQKIYMFLLSADNQNRTDILCIPMRGWALFPVRYHP